MTKGDALTVLYELTEVWLKTEGRTAEEDKAIKSLEMAMRALECPVVFTTCAGCADSHKCRRKGRIGVCTKFKLYSDETGMAKPEVETALIDAMLSSIPASELTAEKLANPKPLSEKTLKGVREMLDKMSDDALRNEIRNFLDERYGEDSDGK